MEGQVVDVEVKQTSYETIKPSIPTLSDRKSLTLSFIDQNFPHVHMPALLVYTSHGDQTQPHNNIMASMKKSLSDALTQFYPLAGRCSDQITALCNDQGVTFIETCVECSLIHVLNNPRNKLDVLSKLLPPKELYCFGQLPIAEVQHLVFQVNVFKCGGVVLGCYISHKLLDACSIGTFLNYWAALASGRSTVDPSLLNFEVAATTFPPPPPPPPVAPTLEVRQGTTDDTGAGSGVAMLWRRLSAIKVVGKSFTIDNVAINKLKAEATSEEVPKPTSFEVVAGFVWKNLMRDDGPSVLSFSASIRARMNPPLPKETIGNLVVAAHVSVQQCGEFRNFVDKIHHEILKLDQKVETMKGPNGLECFLKYRNSTGSPAQASKYNITTWCRLGLDQVDFGFGKPIKVIPFGMVNPLLRNSIILVDYKDGQGDDGVEVWLFLEESDMLNLESNSKFLAVASLVN